MVHSAEKTRTECLCCVLSPTSFFSALCTMSYYLLPKGDACVRFYGRCLGLNTSRVSCMWTHKSVNGNAVVTIMQLGVWDMSCVSCMTQVFVHFHFPRIPHFIQTVQTMSSASLAFRCYVMLCTCCASTWKGNRPFYRRGGEGIFCLIESL